MGCAIFRQLAKYKLAIALVEKESDVGEGVSKGNSALMHTGYDAKPGTLESKMVVEGYRLFTNEVAPALNLPWEKTGALVLARDEAQQSRLSEITKQAARNGLQAVEILSSEEIYAREPHLAPGVLGGILIEQESIVDPFAPPIAYAAQAVVNGGEAFLGTAVTAIHRLDDGVYEIETTSRPLYARYLVNAAGLWGDTVDGLLGIKEFHITPRRGEFIVFDKYTKRLVNHILLQVPTARTKGILIAPTIFGNVLLGPTADDHDDPANTAVSREGLNKILKLGGQVLPALLQEDITAVYAGNRPATEFPDYQINFHRGQSYVTVGGIRSTGLSAALAIARYVAEGMADMGLALNEKRQFKDYRLPNNLSEFSLRPYRRPEMIRESPQYGHIICYCEMVSEQEIRNAIQGPLGARSLKSLRKRTRAVMGRCQGFNCAPTVMRMLSEIGGADFQSLVS